MAVVAGGGSSCVHAAGRLAVGGLQVGNATRERLPIPTTGKQVCNRRGRGVAQQWVQWVQKVKRRGSRHSKSVTSRGPLLVRCRQAGA